MLRSAVKLIYSWFESTIVSARHMYIRWMLKRSGIYCCLTQGPCLPTNRLSDRDLFRIGAYFVLIVRIQHTICSTCHIELDMSTLISEEFAILRKMSTCSV